MGSACSIEGGNCIIKRREQIQEVVTFRPSDSQIQEFICRVSSREYIQMMCRSKKKSHHLEYELAKFDWTPEALMKAEAIIYEVLSDIVVEGDEANDLLEALIEYSPNFRSNPGYNELERGRVYFSHYLEGYVMLITLHNKQRNWWHHHKKIKESSLQLEVDSLKKYLKQHHDIKIQHNKNQEVDIKAFSTECTVREPVLLGILELSAIYLNELFDYAIVTLSKM